MDKQSPAPAVRLWQWLVMPGPTVTDSKARRQAELLATLMILVIPLTLLLAFLSYHTNLLSPLRDYPPAFITASVLIPTLTIYALSRTRHFMLGAWLSIALLSAGIFTVSFVIGGFDIQILVYLLVPVLLCSFFFSLTLATALYIGFNICFALVPLLIPTVTYSELIDGAWGLFLIVGVIILVTRRYRNMLEQDRNSALEQSEARYRLVSELTSDYAYSARVLENGQFEIEWVTQAFATVTGFSVEDVSNWGLWVHPEDLPEVQQRVMRMLAGEEDVHEYRIITRAGRVRWLHVVNRPLLDASGRVTHITGAATDITERKESELAEQNHRKFAEALREIAATLTSTLDVEEVLDRILDSLAQVVPHDSGNVTLVRDGVAEIVRRRRFGTEDSSPVTSVTRFIIADMPTLRQMTRIGRPLLIADTQAAADWVALPNSEWIRSYVGAPIRVDDEVVGFLQLVSSQPGHFTPQHAERLEAFANLAVIAIRNAQSFQMKEEQAAVLEQRVHERTAALLEVQKQQQAILDSVGEGVFYTEDHIIHYVNPELCRQTGYSVEQLMNQPANMFQADSDETGWTDFAARLAGSRIWRGEAQIQGQGERQFDASVTTARISEAGEKPLRAVTIIRDISQEKALIARKNQFIAVASHELRTPLTNFMTRLYLLRRQPERLDNHLQILDEVAGQMKTLVEGLLDLTRFEQGRVNISREPVRLQSIVTSITRLQQPEADTGRISLTLEVDDTVPQVIGDANRLEQVVRNLVNNAIKFTPAGGQVTVGLTGDQRNAIICVRDTGVGIPAEHLPHIFEPFYRLDDKAVGTGLGLSIAREIVELHGGEIRVSSEPGKGTCFEVYLPLA